MPDESLFRFAATDGGLVDAPPTFPRECLYKRDKAGCTDKDNAVLPKACCLTLPPVCGTTLKCSEATVPCLYSGASTAIYVDEATNSFEHGA